jgi:phosphotransferase system  glucose/maltose/N-acetylglucosamine-specific IIC component
MACIVAGMALLMFARFKVTIATWFVLSLILTVFVMRWLETTWGTSLLYYLVVVVIVVLYFVVLLMFVLIPKSFLGVES